MRAHRLMHITRLTHQEVTFFIHGAFIRKATFQHQVRNWTPDKLNRALMLATENEVDSKTTGLPAEILCGRTLIRIAQAARRR